MLMPETSVNENHLTARAKNDVWFTRQTLAVKTVAVSHTMN